jgi:hypothetical protein
VVAFVPVADDGPVPISQDDPDYLDAFLRVETTSVTGGTCQPERSERIDRQIWADIAVSYLPRSSNHRMAGHA